jgi:hypothetical protein
MKFQRISKERTCPECRSTDVHRVKRTGLPVKVLCRILNLRPHRCAECDTLFLAPTHPKPPRIQETNVLTSGGNKGSNQSHSN